MVATAQQRKGKICEICGGVDDKDELIWTCIKCKVTTEHQYCMRTVTEDPNWVCEECNAKPPESTKGVIWDPITPPFHNKVMPVGPSRVQFPFKRQVRPGKVKPISEEEVIKLMSGSEYVRTTRANISHRPSSMGQKVPRAAFKAKPRIPSVSVKNPAHGGRNMYSTVSPLVPRRSEEKRAKAFDDSAERVKKALWTSSTQQVEDQNRFLRDSNHCASLETMKMDVHNMRTLLERLRFYEPYIPAANAIWKGSFKILDNHEETQGQHKAHGLPLDLPAELQQFQAQPATRVCQEAYELSLKMPAELQVKLFPRSEFWTPLFGADLPDLRDIAFYIFPAADAEADRLCRSVENHTKLLECMEAQDMAMRTDVEGVELLIFSSKHLDTSMQDIITRWGRKKFLWGVFSPVEAEVQVSPLPVVVPECNGQPDHGTSNTDNDDYADSMMEIDMEGGKEVGRPDIVVRRKDHSSTTIPLFNGETAADMNASELPTSMQTGSKKCKMESLEATLVGNESAHPLMGQRLVDVKVECDYQEEGAISSILWTPPPADWVKLNVAVATSCSEGTTTAVTAGIIRDSAAKWKIGYTLNLGTTTTQNSNSLKAELKALLEGLKLAWGRGFAKVVVELESKAALECLKNKETTTTTTTATASHDPTEAELIGLCKQRIVRDWDCKLQLVSGEGNSSAQMLAELLILGKISEFKVMNEPPEELRFFLQIDCMKL